MSVTEHSYVVKRRNGKQKSPPPSKQIGLAWNPAVIRKE